MKEKKHLLSDFFNEILLFSGQYALFYIIMNFTKDGTKYFLNLGHTLLLIILIIQTLFLVKFGSRPLYRFLGSLIAPLVYTLIELREGLEFAINIGHIFFWIFSLMTGLLQAIELKTRRQGVKIALEFIVTTLNVTIFIFLYFYFDLSQAYGEQLEKGIISKDAYDDFLEIYHMNKGLSMFFSDITHTYLLIGGGILSFSLAVGRVKIIRLKDNINELFGRYVDKGIRDMILSSTGEKSEKKNIAILFSDIRDFTTISENHTPDEITKMLNYYFTEWDRIVTKHGGVIDKFIGDAIMVLFGISDEKSASSHAVKCAQEMTANLDKIKEGLRSRNQPVINRIGIGINFGEVIIGDIGSEERKNYTVIGDNVNIASRLEAQCKVHSSDLIISETVYVNLSDLLKSRFTFLGVTELKGKSAKIKIYGSTGASSTGKH